MKKGRKVSQHATRLDVCVASQEKLAKFFTKPGTCFGDLRRRRLFTKEAKERDLAEVSVGFDPDAWTEEDLRFVANLERQECDSDWFAQYLMRADLEALHPEGAAPRFSGGTRITLSLHLEGGRGKRRL